MRFESDAVQDIQHELGELEENQLQEERRLRREAAAETGLAEFDPGERATVRNAPVGLAELAWQARALASSMTLPNALRGKPGDILAVMLAGRELGLGPMASTRMVQVISGATTIATELKLALAQRAGHDIAALAEGPGWCVVGCRTHPDVDPLAWAMTREIAAEPWNAGRASEPVGVALAGATIATEIMVESWEGERGARTKTTSPLTDKANWRSYQRNMLFWRASGDFMRRHVPGVAGGIYTLEELGEDRDGD